ncbi:MAG: hypothetical protein ACI4KF_02245 [Huintestinicola sp.]
MGVYLKIGGADVSRYITENEYSVARVPVYDEENAYTNIYGERVRELTGHEVTIKAALYGMSDTAVKALSDAVSAGSARVQYSAPQLMEGSFEEVSTEIFLDSVSDGEKLWNAKIVLHSPFAADCL